MNTDKNNLDELRKYYRRLSNILSNDLERKYDGNYPLDSDIRENLKKIILREDDDEYKIYSYKDEIIKLWSLILEKSIVCLRYFDKREPFQQITNKKPFAYGIEELSLFFKQYTNFESTLYGSVNYYRDHVIHVFRVWLLGINLLLRDNGKFLKEIIINEEYEFNNYEKIAMWSIIALTHDLGYPLEKSYQVIDKTNEMMKAFVSNPTISMDVSFSGVQNSMNDFVLRFISSKMWEIDPEQRKTKEKIKEEFKREVEYRQSLSEEELKKYIKSLRYVARLQPKYYLKFQKSLEHNEHGVLSSLIIYKLLLFFLESDYSLNEDYMFDYEDARQFYIRREILRPIASHTCKDIYQNDALCFSFLLIICDDAQEWGRKNITQLYVNEKTDYEFAGVNIEVNDDSSEISISDRYSIAKKEIMQKLLISYRKQCIDYRNLFRDGQDTSNRNFNFYIHLYIKSTISEGQIQYNLSLEIKKENQTKVIAKIEQDHKFKKKDILKLALEEIFKDYGGCALSSEDKILEVSLG